MKTQTKKAQVGDLEVTLTSDIYLGKVLDTRVEINGETLCWVAGECREEFIEKLNDIIKEYRI